jgi:F-type H+-transporting ATPase subunit alpha
VSILFAGTRGFLDNIAVAGLRKFEIRLYDYIEKYYPLLPEEMGQASELTAGIIEKLEASCRACAEEFSSGGH